MSVRIGSAQAIGAVVVEHVADRRIVPTTVRLAEGRLAFWGDDELC